MSLLNVVEAGDLAQSFASPTRSAGIVGGMNIGGWDRTRVVSSPLVFQPTLFLLLLLSSCLVKGLAILGMRGMSVQGIWGLVLSLFGEGGGLVSRIPSC